MAPNTGYAVRNCHIFKITSIKSIRSNMCDPIFNNNLIDILIVAPRELFRVTVVIHLPASADRKDQFIVYCRKSPCRIISACS